MIKNLGVYLKASIRWLLISAVIGAACGLIGAGFYWCIREATAFRLSHTWILFGLPVAGLLIAWLYKKAGFEKDPGTDAVLASVNSDFRLPFRMAPLIFVSTVLTHLFGGSAGREGAALQMGGSVGMTIGRALKLPEEDSHTVIMCGMSALFSALFGTPVTAMVFSMEVISIGIFHYGALLPCMVSSFMAAIITRAFGIAPEAFLIPVYPAMDVVTGLRVLGLAALCAGLSIVFCEGMHKSGQYMRKWLPNPYVRAAVGGVAIIALTLLVGNQDYNGAGMNIVEKAIGGEARPEAFALKFLFTMITLGAGFKGGEIVPSFFIGATFGCIAGPILGLPAGFAAAIGMISVFCGAVNCPLASIFLSIELFGAEGLLMFALACALSYVLSGYFGLYGKQKILYSKLKTEYINRFTK